MLKRFDSDDQKDTDSFLVDVYSQRDFARQQNDLSMLQPMRESSLQSKEFPFADKNFTGEITNIPKITREVKRRAATSVLFVFNALDFSTIEKSYVKKANKVVKINIVQRQDSLK